MVAYGLRQRLKYARLIRRQASSPRAQGADGEGHHYFVQLIVQGTPYHKPKNQPGNGMLGLDIGPSTLAVVPRAGEAHLVEFCEELHPDMRKKRRLQRKMQRQRRANSPHNYDERGRAKQHGKRRLHWHDSRGYQATRRRHATQERKLAAHRKSLHGQLVNELVRVGNHIQIEKTSFKGWQKLYGSSVGLRAPGLFVAHLTRTVAKTGGTLSEVPTYHSKLSQYCHNCKRYVKKPLSERWHTCPCGIGPVQRNLYAAFLLAYLEPGDTLPSISLKDWEGAELRLRAEMERLQQRAKEGQSLPRSFGIPGLRPKRPLISCHYGGGTAEAMRLKQRLTFARKSRGDRSMARKGE